MLFILGIILFITLVVVHEYGHFLVAKRNGVEVEEFGIGFPLKIAGKKLGKGIFESYYTINLLPLGGFVRLKGENDSDKRKGSLGAASTWAKVKIMMAGVAMNFLAAIVFLSLASAVGFPELPKQIVPNQFYIASDTKIIKDEVRVVGVEENSPASKIGIKAGDSIRAIGGKPINSTEQLMAATKKFKGDEVVIRFQNEDDKLIEKPVKLRESEKDGHLGVAPRDLTVRRSTWSSPIVGTGLTYQLSKSSVILLGQTVGDLVQGDTEKATENVGGPVIIGATLLHLETFGELFFIIGIISLTLAIMNALPIPALDGGRLAVMLLFKAIQKITGKNYLTERIENAIHGTGFVALMILAVLITYVDIGRVSGG